MMGKSIIGDKSLFFIQIRGLKLGTQMSCGYGIRFYKSAALLELLIVSMFDCKHELWFRQAEGQTLI